VNYSTREKRSRIGNQILHELVIIAYIITFNEYSVRCKSKDYISGFDLGFLIQILIKFLLNIVMFYRETVLAITISKQILLSGSENGVGFNFTALLLTKGIKT